MKRIATILIFTFFSLALMAQERYLDKIFNKVNVTYNIEFGENINAENKLQKLKFDVYIPDGDTSTNRILLIMIHGGAYWSGDKNHGECKLIGQDLGRMGYVIISPQYRYEPSFISLLDEEKMVKAVARGTQDAKAILRYVYKDFLENGNSFGIDTGMIFIGGASAGSFNALHAAYLDEADTLPGNWWQWINEVGGIEGNSGNPGYPSKMKGVVNISGALARASTMDNNHVPFVSIHNTKDPQIPFNHGQPYGIVLLPFVDGSNVLHQKANELGILNPFYIIPTEDHTAYENLGARVQPYYDSTVFYMTHFMYDIYRAERLTTGFRPLKNLPQLKVYPNPARGSIQFQLDALLENKVLQYDIFDMTGRLVQQGSLTGSNKIALNPSIGTGQFCLQLREKDVPLALGYCFIQP